jgi:hypothetical protein
LTIPHLSDAAYCICEESGGPQKKIDRDDNQLLLHASIVQLPPEVLLTVECRAVCYDAAFFVRASRVADQTAVGGWGSVLRVMRVPVVVRNTARRGTRKML